MKKIYQWILALGIIIFLINSCAREEGIPVKADFSITVVNNDYSVPVVVQITNRSTGADTYSWSFEGANISSSTENNPKPITYASKGVYKIILKASNKDGNSDTKTIEIQVDAAMKVDFDFQMQGSDISPVTLQMVDKSLGATSYQWTFDGGNPATSTDQNPKVSFSTPGTHTIKLTISNGKETYSTEKTITVKPAMTVDFDWSVDAIDNDYQAPVLIHLYNKSTNATSYSWSINGAIPAASTDISPNINLPTAGTYTISLTATNDKESKTIQKQVVVHPDTNLLTFTDVKLGINTAHSSVGSFFSSVLGKVVTKNEVNLNTGNLIDFAYFGFDSTFKHNEFVSPDAVQNTAFTVIPNAIHTKIINSQEGVGIQVSPSKFDAINDGSDFNNIIVKETAQGKASFNNSIVPRVVLFQTNDGRKGAIKIKGYIANGLESYILVDIKVQKKP